MKIMRYVGSKWDHREVDEDGNDLIGRSLAPGERVIVEDAIAKKLSDVMQEVDPAGPVGLPDLSPRLEEVL